MGLIRKGLRAGLFVASPLTAASVKNVKGESKKQRSARRQIELQEQILAELRKRS